MTLVFVMYQRVLLAFGNRNINNPEPRTTAKGTPEVFGFPSSMSGRGKSCMSFLSLVSSLAIHSLPSFLSQKLKNIATRAVSLIVVCNDVCLY